MLNTSQVSTVEVNVSQLNPAGVNLWLVHDRGHAAPNSCVNHSAALASALCDTLSCLGTCIA